MLGEDRAGPVIQRLVLFAGQPHLSRLAPVIADSNLASLAAAMLWNSIEVYFFICSWVGRRNCVSSLQRRDGPRGYSEEPPISEALAPTLHDPDEAPRRLQRRLN